MFGVPLNTLPYVMYDSDNLPLGIIALIYANCHSKQLQEGLIEFSDNKLHFLKKFFEFTKTILWL